jgi:hypothetical protein
MMDDDARRLARLEDEVAQLKRSLLVNYRVTRDILRVMDGRPETVDEAIARFLQPVVLMEPST